MLLALTLVLVIVVILMASSQVVLFALLGALAGYYYACREMGDHRHDTGRLAVAGARAAGRSREGFVSGYDPQAGSTEVFGPGDQPAPYAVFAETGHPDPAEMGAAGDYDAPTIQGRPRYPGAIEIDEYDTEPDQGHVDRDRDEDYPQGNPYDPARVRADLSAGPCVDDEANDNEIDGDERMAYQGYARNDATRVTAGTINRRRDMDKYFRAEVEEAEDREWWGRHEV